jgi:putative transposase
LKKLKAYKFELKTNGAQQRQLRSFAGACRFVFNQSLAWQNSQYREDSTFQFRYVTIANLLPSWKKQYSWLKDAPSQSLQHSIKDLERSFQNFFAKRADFPRFKRRGQSASFRFPQGVKLDQENSRIQLPKLGWVRYRNSREVLGEVGNVTVSQSNGKWYVSIQTEIEVDDPIPEATSAVGIDMGIARFATLSDGAFLAPLNSFRRHEQRLARYQRAMSRKQKFSNNWKKAKVRVQELHARIGNLRRDYLHKATTPMSKNHALVIVEDLKIRHMSKSAAGTIDAPGRNVSAKSGRNKAILDQGWFEFRRQLEYKLTWKGGQLIAVPPQYTSQSCPCCGHVSRDNRQTQAKFECVAFGFAEHADLVGAININTAGLAVLACGEVAQSGASMKQEPTEETAHVTA